MTIKPSRQILANIGTIIATLGGIGWLPLAPGTWGSLVCLPFAWFLIPLFGTIELIIICCGLFLLGAWACERYSRLTGTHDSSHCVIDKFLGQLLVLSFLPLSFYLYFFAFVLFRFFDIYKAWPANWVDSNVDGGVGIMLDDVIAAVQALVILAIGSFVFNVLIT